MYFVLNCTVKLIYILNVQYLKRDMLISANLGCRLWNIFFLLATFFSFFFFLHVCKWLQRYRQSPCMKDRQKWMLIVQSHVAQLLPLFSTGEKFFNHSLLLSKLPLMTSFFFFTYNLTVLPSLWYLAGCEFVPKSPTVMNSQSQTKCWKTFLTVEVWLSKSELIGSYQLLWSIYTVVFHLLIWH